MPSKSNIEMLEKATQSFKDAGGVFLVDYRGLSVKEAQEVRHAIREAGGEMKVYKNNIVRLALEANELPALDEVLVGQVACVFYGADPVPVAKAIKDEAKKLNKLVIGRIASFLDIIGDLV
jgi:large subunit ribosomal protein L10